MSVCGAFAQDTPAPDAASLNFILGLRGNTGSIAQYFAHQDRDGDGVPDVFEAALLQLVLVDPELPKSAEFRLALQDCTDKIWKTKFLRHYLELCVFYMAIGQDSRDFAVWLVSSDWGLPEMFEPPLFPPTEYSTGAYGFFTGTDDPNGDGLTNYDTFLSACSKFGLDGTNFMNWTEEEWGLAYEDNWVPNTDVLKSAPDVLSAFLTETLAPPPPPVPAVNMAGAAILIVMMVLSASILATRIPKRQRIPVRVEKPRER